MAVNKKEYMEVLESVLMRAMANYANIPSLGKCIIIFCMLMGRLEIYGLMALDT